jgi:hypothetical protein
LAAHFVSGYLYDPGRHEPMVGGGNTHAWVQVFLPGSGWIEFDPTNGVASNPGLIRVAVARDPYHAIPISGSWRGFPADNLGLKVSVSVHCQPTTDVEDDMPQLVVDAADSERAVRNARPDAALRAESEQQASNEQPAQTTGETEQGLSTSVHSDEQRGSGVE